MITNSHHITVAGIAVEIVRKDIKNLHLGVYPPAGRVRVAAPLVITDDAVRLAIIDKLGWIKLQKAKFAEQPRQSAREMVSGESHYFMGQRYRLTVMAHDAAMRVEISGKTRIRLYTHPEATTEHRLHALNKFYRRELKTRAEPLIRHWEKKMGVRVAEWGVKQMKTKWGSCTVDARRIWLNLELAKKPVQCLEYVIVHELVHLLARHHDDRFRALMDRFMPQWRLHREVLNRSVLGYERWGDLRDL